MVSFIIFFINLITVDNSEDACASEYSFNLGSITRKTYLDQIPTPPTRHDLGGSKSRIN